MAGGVAHALHALQTGASACRRTWRVSASSRSGCGALQAWVLAQLATRADSTKSLHSCNIGLLAFSPTNAAKSASRRHTAGCSSRPLLRECC